MNYQNGIGNRFFGQNDILFPCIGIKTPAFKQIGYAKYMAKLVYFAKVGIETPTLQLDCNKKSCKNQVKK